MAHVTESRGSDWTAADLVERFGAIPLGRVRTTPLPGRATEADAIALRERDGGLCELIDGALVEKTVGWYESYLAILLATMLRAYVSEKRMGIVLGADGLVRLARGQLRIPDVSFISQERLSGATPREAVFPHAPDLAVEIISEGNTAAEMERKLADFFTAAVKEVWYVYPVPHEIVVYTDPQTKAVFNEPQTLEGTPLLPGFRLNLTEFFALP